MTINTKCLKLKKNFAYFSSFTNLDPCEGNKMYRFTVETIILPTWIFIIKNDTWPKVVLKQKRFYSPVQILRYLSPNLK